ncbi:hypothetical protein [Myroides fluvii]|uniref:hypothetical protein n=1 Tax=Myroides fluvii TaxID=2572594 RepID=UPI00131CF908|nr:hypothetical protein [Myroides fluvii]
MIRRLIPLVALVLSGSAMAQIGIGTQKATSSAQLDVVALKKGVLLPRVELKNSTEFSPIEGEQVESLLVYHIGNTNLKAGFYYWKSNAWTPLLSGDTFIDRQNKTFTIAGNPTKNGEESLVITDSENHSVYLSVAEIANNSTFVTNLVENNEFITKLGDNIDFVNYITNNNEFIENIVNKLRGKYGNVNYNPVTNTFVYYDEHGVEHAIDWSVLNTTNVSFTLVNDQLVVTDSDQNSVRLDVKEIANNSTFVTNLVENNEFITKLGDNIDFVNYITNNNEFIENIVNKLKGKYGNVNYNPVTNTFVYYDEHGVEHAIDWSVLNTTNVSFTLVNDQLVVTDSDQNSVRLDVKEIANNSTFVTNLVENNEFITKLGDNIDFVNYITNNNEFIENIVNKLRGKYGNVNYNPVTNTFVYYDEHGVEHAIDWSVLNTTNVSFTLVNDQLVVTDSDQNSVRLDVKEIANNSTFITELVENNEFITKLGDNIDFVNHITNNNEFIENIVNKLKGKYGNVNYNPVTNTFVYYDEHGVEHAIDWSVLNTTNVSFTLVNDQLVVTDSDQNSVRLDVKEIANNSTFITELVENNEFITKLGDNIDFVNYITNNNEFIENIVNKLKGKYGNVNYNPVTNTFVYYDEHGVEHAIDWSVLNTTNVSFTLVNDQLVVTDSDQNSVRLDVKEIANNSTFVTNLAENNEFITKLGDNIDFVNYITNNNEFIENIVNKLKGKYGNVNYNPVTNTFVYYDEHGVEHAIDWSVLNTTNVSFTLVNDQLVVTDSDQNSVRLDVKEIANNSTFVTNLVENNEFITKLGDNIDFVNYITNNNEFIENIVNKLRGKYGNVNYNPVTNTFVYYDEHGVEHAIDWSVLNTTNVSFTLVNDQLVVTDSDQNSVRLDVKEIANNSTFVTNLVENNEFITKLGDNIDFVNHITNNNEFIENIVNKLKGKYGNVNYNPVTNTFVYYDEHGVEHAIDWSVLNTTNVSFTLVNDQLVVTDSDQNSVRLDVKEIANNSTFVTNLAENNEFITKLGDNIDFVNHITNNNEFIENIVNKLKGKYGNVNYNPVTNTFVYYDEHGVEHAIDWSALNTTNVRFELIADQLVVTDSDQNSVRLDVAEIANNSTFITELVENNEFITKLGDNNEFQTIIKNNSAEATLVVTDKTINAEAVKAGFTFNNGKDLTTVAFAETLTAMAKGADAEGFTEYYFVDETGENDPIAIQVSQDIINDFEKIINNTTVNNLLKQFISTATGDVSVVRNTNGDIVISTASDAFNLTDEIQAKETNTLLTAQGAGVYVYQNEEAIKTNGAGITINVVADVQNNFQEIIDNSNVQTILNEYITQNVSNIRVEEKNGDTYFIINEGGVEKEVNITELIRNNSFLASLRLTTVNENQVKAGFAFNDGKNTDSKLFAETLTSITKGTDADQKIEYTYVDETGEEAMMKITVTQDVITDFGTIINDTTVKNLLEQFISTATGDVSVIRDAAGDIIIKTAADIFNLTTEIKSKETKTTLTPVKYDVFVYIDGDLEVHEEVERPGEYWARKYEGTKFVYNNEEDVDVEIKGTDLFGPTGSNNLETVTSLTLEDNYGGVGKALVYENEERAKSPIYIKDILDHSESLTKLEAKLDTRELIYTDEEQVANIISFNDLVQEPWYTGSDVQATQNDQDIYTMGWVGIGYKTKSTAPNERLRVNGSITATNSYYADYVFENYFDGYSSLKYDYSFNDLNTVDHYIKTNRHLPGITPISELEKTASGYSFNVSELSIQLLEKTEELFLHVIEQKKELDQKADEIQVLKNEVRDLTERLEAIEALLK